jgi:succinate dehydrogenase / fumarate reductase cytochrome b subunit
VKSKHIFLNVFLIKLPITAMTSIAHRVTGLFLFLCIPIFLYFLKISLASESSFLLAKNLFDSLYIKFFLFIFLSSLIYHFVMGIKHIVMDLGYFESKTASSNFSLFALILSVLLIFLSILI